MEATSAAPTQYLLGNGCNQKHVHLVRHAQGLHNLDAKKNPDRRKRIEFIDPELSSYGWQEVADQRKNVSESGLLGKIEVVLTSPMLRTLQTAVGIFGGEDLYASEAPNIEKNDNPTAISTFNRLPPIIATELLRERMGKRRKRAAVSQLRARFPAVDFSMIESEDDVLWEDDRGETNEEVAVRGIEFIKWLLGRKEKEIAVVGHGVFLQETMIALKGKCHSMEGDPDDRFQNCEIRLVIISDNSVMRLESDSSPRKQYNGRIPYGLQLQIDSAKKINVCVDEMSAK